MNAQDIPDDATGDALRRLLNDGSDLSKPMEIDFHVAVPSERAGEHVAEAASKRGYSTRVVHNVEHNDWTCACTRTMVPRHDKITAAELELDGLSEPHGGYSDGWGSFGNANR